MQAGVCKQSGQEDWTFRHCTQHMHPSLCACDQMGTLVNHHACDQRQQPRSLSALHGHALPSGVWRSLERPQVYLAVPIYLQVLYTLQFSYFLSVPLSMYARILHVVSTLNHPFTGWQLSQSCHMLLTADTLLTPNIVVLTRLDW